MGKRRGRSRIGKRQETRERGEEEETVIRVTENLWADLRNFVLAK